MPNATTKAEATSCCFQDLSILASWARCGAANGSVGCYATIIGKRPEGLGLSDSGIQTAGLIGCVVLTALLTLLKFLGAIDWLWWRIGLPLGVYVGFQVAYTVTGFIYLSQAEIGERSPEDQEEVESLAGDNDVPYFWLAWVNLILFAVGVSEWVEPSGVGHGFWQAFGNPGVMIAFGSLAVVNLFLFWSSIGQMLNG